MNIRSIRGAVLTLAISLVAACGATPAGAQATASPSIAPSTYDEFSAALCASFTSLVRAVGNPDAGTPSIMSKALDKAVAGHDAVAADRAASAMLAELEAGRQQAAIASRWEPATATMAQMDRLLAAFQAMTAAKRSLAGGAGASADPQQAFETAGGVQAWGAVLQGIGSIAPPPGASPQPCKAFTGQI